MMVINLPCLCYDLICTGLIQFFCVCYGIVRPNNNDKKQHNLGLKIVVEMFNDDFFAYQLSDFFLPGVLGILGYLFFT